MLYLSTMQYRYRNVVLIIIELRLSESSVSQLVSCIKTPIKLSVAATLKGTICLTNTAKVYEIIIKLVSGYHNLVEKFQFNIVW